MNRKSKVKYLFWILKSTYTYLVPKQSSRSDDVFEQVFCNVRVDCTQRVIHDVEIGILVESSCETHALLLSATQVDALKRHTF